MSVPLTYDTLPHYSRLRREMVDGVLQITAAPQEPGPLMRKAAMLAAAAPAAVTCLLVLVVGFAVFGAMYLAHRSLMPDWLAVVLGICFAVLCAALFALIWRVQYLSRIEQIQKALEQSTVIAASPNRLVIETAGPFGTASHDLQGIACNFRVAFCDEQQNVFCIQIETSQGSRLQILPGRDRAELNWVINQLRTALESSRRGT